MICRFVGKAVGEQLRVGRAKAAVQGAALQLQVVDAALDRAIWRFESGRENVKTTVPSTR